ncbi:hypothetical protein Sgleb_08110 [Streptomyces glebosus]|uniref:Uncharacterized protein n=1 Tax=Streptomyces glebosus TaxID=249580 RepID=A0A640SPD4_9ACTN|nr:hypothetical protein Sgleb_08110 [Streptomyces glebosus]GHG90608.1 hypothetical protein GCM10010513_73890 [Streptomyces glebosus]
MVQGRERTECGGHLCPAPVQGDRHHDHGPNSVSSGCPYDSDCGTCVTEFGFDEPSAETQQKKQSGGRTERREPPMWGLPPYAFRLGPVRAFRRSRTPGTAGGRRCTA